MASTNQRAIFGSGAIYFVPPGTNPTPVKIGTCTEIGVDYTSEQKELFGSKRFAIAIANGKATLGGKIKAAEIDGRMLTAVMGGTVTTGRRLQDEYAASIPATPGPYTVTVPNSATFAADLGVVNTTTGLTLKNVASAPATGQYSFAAGVYTFAAADQGIAVRISYEWTDATNGATVAVTNTVMGPTTTFQLCVWEKDVDGTAFGLKMYAVTFGKLGLGFKSDDFVMPDLDFKASADAQDRVVDLYIPEGQ